MLMMYIENDGDNNCDDYCNRWSTDDRASRARDEADDEYGNYRCVNAENDGVMIK